MRLLLPALILVLGCAGDLPSSEPVRAPTRTRFEQQKHAPLPPDPFSDPVAEVDEWTLEGPLADAIDVTARTAYGVFDSFLEQELEQRPGLAVATEEMHCVARELGRFVREQRANPPDGLRSFILARCGVPGGQLAWSTRRGEAPADWSDAALLEHWEGSLGEQVADLLAGGAAMVGTWFVREGGEAFWIAAAARRQLRLDRIPATSAHFELSGEVLERATRVFASVNVGRHGFAKCGADSTLALPRFRLVCDASPDDESAWVKIGFSRPGRLLGTNAASLLVRPGGAEVREWHAPKPLGNGLVDSPEEAARVAAYLVNIARRRAGLPELEVAVAQSESLAALAPHFFGALLGTTDEAVADLIYLGARMGYDLDGVVETSDVTWGFSRGSADLGRVIAEVLEEPSGRETLLDRNAEWLAVGVTGREDEAPVAAAMFATYAIFSERDHARRVEQVWERIEAERRERGRREPVRLPELDALAHEAAREVQAGGERKAVLQGLLDASMKLLGRGVQGWVADVGDLDQLELPAEFLERPSLELCVAVAFHRPEGAPDGRYVVLLVAAQPTADRI